MTITLKIRDHLSCSKGMTLIDLAIALVVLGLLIVPFAQIAKNRDFTVRDGNTRANMGSIQAALDQYYFVNNSYPCPADPTLNAQSLPADGEYGLALIDPAAPAGVSPCTGTAVDMGGDLMVGAIPFKDLKLPIDAGLDGWKNKLTYAVSGQLTRTDQPFNPSAGILNVVGFQQNSFSYDNDGDGVTDEVALTCTDVDLPLANNAHWVVTSSGRAGIGAYNANGTLNQACPDGGDATRESENCDYTTGDTTFRAETCAASLNNDVTYFDDLLRFKNVVPTRIWAPSSADNTQIFSDIDLIGIHNDNPQVELDVTGTVLISSPNTDADPTNDDPDKDGTAQADQICDTAGNNCFDPELIGGDDEDMRCASSDTSSVMSGVGNSSALCDVELGLDLITGSCPGGYMIGIDGTDGSPICATP